MGKIANMFREQSITLAQEQRRQMLSLDREFDEMETKINRLESENLHLKAQVKPLEREVQRLKDEIERASKKPVHGDELDEKAVRILQAYAGATDSMQKFRVAAALGLSVAEANHYFPLLVKHKFIFQSTAAQDPGYRILGEGTEYLAKRGLLK